MFEEARERRRLRKNLAEARALEAPHLSWGEPDFEERSEEFLQARRKVRFAEFQLDKFETEMLVQKARKYGIDPFFNIVDPEAVTTDQDSGLPPDEVTRALTWIGRAKLQAQVSEEQRKSWQFWLMVITALTGLGGTLIGIISALKR